MLTFLQGCRIVKKTSLSKEEHLLVLASRLHLASEDKAEINNILGQAPDWQCIIRDSGTLGVQPLLHRHLSGEQFAHKIPEDVKLQLRRSYKEQSIRNLWIYGQINRMLEVLAPANIRVVLMKGAFLAKWVYRDIALRPMNDIDLLCRTEDVGIFREGLFQLGFSQESFKSPLHASLAPRFDHLPPFHHSGKLKVEAHLNIFCGLPHNTDDMKKVWDRTTPSGFENPGPAFLSPDDHLLHLTLHLGKHMETGFPMFYWFCDIHEMVNLYGHEIDWDRFAGIIKSLGSGGKAGALLRLLASHWNTPIPEGLLERLGGLGNPLHLAAMIPGEQTSAMKKRKVLPRYVRLVKRLNQSGGGGKGLLLLWKTFFPSRAWIIEHYGLRQGRSVWFYRLFHVLTPFIKLAGSLWHSMVYVLRQALHPFSGSRKNRKQT